MSTITTTNPANGQVLDTYTLHTTDQVEAIISQSTSAYEKWSQTSLDYRIALVRQLASVIESDKETCAQLMMNEMGKLHKAAIAELDKCILLCNYYSDHAGEMLDDVIIETAASKSYVSYRPLGPILAVMPWNFPFWQVFRFAIPTLIAGNTGILKHASLVPGCALKIDELFRKAGFPAGVWSTLLLPGSEIHKVIVNRKIKGISLTGSGPAGSAVASAAGQSIKPCVLELGGNDPYLILHDANIDHAVEQCTVSRLLNAGQSCIGAKRFVVVEDVYDEFLDKFTVRMENTKVGSPDSECDLGPLASIELRDEVHAQVQACVAQGAVVHTGGHIPDIQGAYYPPTVLSNITPGMPAYDDEIFGPVAGVFKACDEKEAIQIANDTKFGLGAGVFTGDIQKGEYIAKHLIHAGNCFVNRFVRSDPRLPFGGINQSGFGRELSREGLYAFTNIKSVVIA